MDSHIQPCSEWKNLPSSSLLWRKVTFNLVVRKSWLKSVGWGWWPGSKSSGCRLLDQNEVDKQETRQTAPFRVFRIVSDLIVAAQENFSVIVCKRTFLSRLLYDILKRLLNQMLNRSVIIWKTLALEKRQNYYPFAKQDIIFPS